MSEGINLNVSEGELKTEGEEKDMEVSKKLDVDDSLKEEVKVEEPAEEKKPSKKKIIDIEDEEPQLVLLKRPVVIESGIREKRKFECLEMSVSTPNDKKQFHVPEGTGEKLGDCPRIEYQLNKVKAEDLKIIHRTLFDRPGSVSAIKKNIRKFNGFDFGKDDKRFEKKRAQLSKSTTTALKKMCKIFDLERSGSKEDILNKLMDFLIEPKSSGKSVPKPKKKRKSGDVKAKSKGKKSVSKKKKSSDSSDLSASEDDEEEEEEDDDDDDEDVGSEESEESEHEIAVELRVLIRYCWKRGLSIRKAAEEICAVEGEGTIAYAAISKWYKRFDSGEMNVQDKPRTGQPLKLDDGDLQTGLDMAPSSSTRELTDELWSWQIHNSPTLEAANMILSNM